jgi:hypothetical protein
MKSLMPSRNPVILARNVALFAFGVIITGVEIAALETLLYEMVVSSRVERRTEPYTWLNITIV